MTATTADGHLAAGIERNKLFLLSCLSLIVTAMTFAIRAGILTQLSDEFQLSDTELGWVNSMAFLGFPLAMVVFGFLYNKLGPRLIMILAFAGHVLGLVLTITAGGFLGLLISTFFIGFANGSVEAACNPLVADLYKDDKTKWWNRDRRGCLLCDDQCGHWLAATNCRDADPDGHLWLHDLHHQFSRCARDRKDR